jgi:hypothetical protein
MYILRELRVTAPSLQALVFGAPTDGYVIRASSHSEPADASRPRMQRCVRNLAPATLAVTDWMDLSLQTRMAIHFFDEASGTRGKLDSTVHYSRSVKVFPQGTTGFVYLYVPDPGHPIGAQLRFRVVSEPNPAGFATGHDLRTADGSIWYLWLPTLMRQSAGDAFARITTRQGLLPHDVAAHWRVAGGAVQCSRASNVLVCPGAEPFAWDLSKGGVQVILGTGIRARYVTINSPFISSTRPRVALFKGDLPLSLREQTLISSTCIGQALVNLMEEPAKKTFHLHVHKVMGLQTTLEHNGALSVPEEGATVKLGSGPRLWKLMQEVREGQTLAP